jgi:hypothetical protein
VPNIKLNVTSQKINVSDWTAPQISSSGWLISSAHAEDYIAGTTIPYDYLKMVNADITLNIKKVVVDKDVTVDNLQADISVQNGVFKANIKNAETMGAKLNGQVNLDSPKSLPYLKLNINSPYVDLQKLTCGTTAAPQAAKKNADNRSWSLISTAEASELIANTAIPYQYFKLCNADANINVKKLQLNDEMVLAEKERIEGLIKPGSIKANEFKENIKKLMWEKVSIVREEKKLNEALKQLQEMQKDLNKLDVSDKSQYNNELLTALEVINMVEICILVVKSAILRRESRGAHYRSDFPESNDAWKRSIVLNKNKIKFEAR